MMPNAIGLWTHGAPLMLAWCCSLEVKKSENFLLQLQGEKSSLFLYVPFSAGTRKCIASPSTPQQSYTSPDTNKQGGDHDKTVILAHLQEYISAFVFHWSWMHLWKWRWVNIEWLWAFCVADPSHHLSISFTCSNMGTWLVLFQSIVLLNPDDAIQPRAQCYPFFLQTKDNILPQKGAKCQKYWAF